MTYCESLEKEISWSEMEELDVAENVQLEDVQKFFTTFLKSGVHVESLIHGNMNRDVILFS